MPASTTNRRAPAMPPEQRRAAIVAATLPLLAEHGEGVTSRQIAEAAGVAEGTIFRVFADKDALLTAALEAAVDRAAADEAYLAIDPDADLVEALTEVVTIIQQRIDEVWGVVAKLRPELRQRISRPVTDSEALVDVLGRYADQLRVEPRLAARLLRALTLSVSHPMLFAGDLAPETIVDQFLHGAGAR